MATASPIYSLGPSTARCICTWDSRKGADLTTVTTGSTYTDMLHVDTGVTVPLSDDFESGNFSAWPWQLSDVGTAANWAVESSTLHSGNFAAQSGAIGPASNSTLSVTLSVPAGELSFWRKVTSATGSGSLIFEIDGTPQLQLSGSMPWQQSFFWVSAGQHTFTWLYGKRCRRTPAATILPTLTTCSSRPARR